jgi:site-specific DNA recombinase
VALGHKDVPRWNLPDGWVISARPAHPALVSEADFIAAQAVNAARGPVPRSEPRLPGDGRRYLLAGLLTCGTCGRRMESAWSNGKPAYRCRHGHTSASLPDPDRQNAYVREEIVLAQLPAVYGVLTRVRSGGSARSRRRTPRDRCERSGDRCRGHHRIPARVLACCPGVICSWAPGVASW